LAALDTHQEFIWTANAAPRKKKKSLCANPMPVIKCIYPQQD